VSVALWRPAASVYTLRERARLLERIRAFFRAADVLEVETPACSRHAGTDPAIGSLRTRFTGPGRGTGTTLYLQTSPEFPMKRLLAAGSGPIYQICRVFRDGEAGRLHNPEFSLLEWYRPGFDHHRLMDEVAALVSAVAQRPLAQRRVSYRELFLELLRLDPHTADVRALRACALAQGVPGAAELRFERSDPWLDLLLTHCVEPRLEPQVMTFVFDYPVSQAALARVRADEPAVAERFELYLGGMELANGFHELTDAAEQSARFRRDLAQRAAAGLEPVPMDLYLLAALEAGLPDCSGVAVGLDRLLMWLTGAEHIREVLAFDLERA
jgi:lysyl-tRNA synthetase class 2